MNAARVLVLSQRALNESEAAYLERYRFALRDRGAELIAVVDAPVGVEHDFPCITIQRDLIHHWRQSKSSSTDLALPSIEPQEEERLLAHLRKRIGPEQDNQDRCRRQLILSFNFHLILATLALTRPSLVITGIGKAPAAIILRRFARLLSCPVIYFGRGPFHNTLLAPVDKNRNLIVRSTSPSIEEDMAPWLAVMERLAASYRQKGSTWIEQPNRLGPKVLRHRLNIPDSALVVLFVGQNGTEWAPGHFHHSLDAFKWLLSVLDKRKNLFIIGKHHPATGRSPEEYRAAAAGRAAWLTDVSLADCLAAADRVAGVDSTVLYEALLLEKPVLALGDCLFKGQQIAYEIEDISTADSVIRAWLEADQLEARKRRWLEFGAYLLSTVLYAMDPPHENLGMRDAIDAADRTAELLRTTTAIDYSLISQPEIPQIAVKSVKEALEPWVKL